MSQAPNKIHSPEFQAHGLNETGIWKAEQLRKLFDGLLLNLTESIIPPLGRYTSIVRTKLEEACMFAAKAIASDPANQAKDGQVMVPCAICGEGPAPCAQMCDACQKARSDELIEKQIAYGKKLAAMVDSGPQLRSANGPQPTGKP